MPRFRKNGRHDNFHYLQGFEIKGNRVYLPKIGWISFFKSRDIRGTPQNVTTVSRRVKFSNNWPIDSAAYVLDPALGYEDFSGVTVKIAPPFPVTTLFS